MSTFGWICIGVLVLSFLKGALMPDDEWDEYQRSKGRYVPPEIDPTPPPPSPSNSVSTPKTSYIRTKFGDPIGSFVTSSHQTAAHDKYGSYLGYYDSKTDQTYNKSGSPIADGNVLSTLLL